VRFYLSFDNGATWDDQGMTSFQAYNVPEGTEGSKRLEYAVSLAIDPARKLCFFNPLIQVRAILSWNLAVPCADPNKVPTWGNREETLINIAPSAQAPAGKQAVSRCRERRCWATATRSKLLRHWAERPRL
jgi:hypothetical protein